MMKSIFFILLFGGISVCTAQKLNGLVTDSYKDPLPEVLIYSSGNHHTHSDVSGRFRLKDVAAGDTIFFRFLGYKTMKAILTPDDFKREITFVLEEEYFELEQISVSNALKSPSIVAIIDLNTNPVNSSQEILMRVPGLVVGQHAGGGKAEQIFLRGFDIDHGTDISISVDGMPVNMVSHAHGQGYADLHFLIPETIDRIDFGKGPYYSDAGNFNTAGYVNFKTRNKLKNSVAGIEYGDFNTARILGMFALPVQKEHHDAYIATEYLMTDGPVESPQNFNRLNIMGKYTLGSENGNQLSLTASRFQSKWDASGQIPQRLVDEGTITRFGYVDNTEGGSTSRTNLNLELIKVLTKNKFLKTNAFYSHYDFELYSNFTFFLEDPENGDQIRQRENRNIFGFNAALFQTLKTGDIDIDFSAGLGLRYDDIDENELSHTKNRKTTLNNISLGDVDETNLQGFADAKINFGDLVINPGIRLDYFNFGYQDRLAPSYTNESVGKAIISPKFNILYNPNKRWHFYLKSGMGFHSNDSRVVTSGNGKKTLPAAYGADLGFIWKPIPKLWINTALWHLFLEQEFVYVGDAGIVEPSGKTRRSGMDLVLRYQLMRNLFLDTDFTYTYARAIEEEEGEDYIPLAVDLMAAGGLLFQNARGFSGGIRYRYVKDRPANENSSITAPGYFITDLNINYAFKSLVLGLSVNNLFNREWNEAQFATESQLKNEPEPVEEVHFTPGVPFYVKGSINYLF